MEIKIEHQLRLEYLNELGVLKWEIWNKEVSKFPWTYDSQETCYFLEGEALVTPDRGEAVQMGKGNLVIFPAGISCRWEITKDVKKHYYFE
ncbi:cupin domain-containing protein [Nostoc sp.]|uniref:cupin domain-containing protein n=1 Tax=Nostoc sp. TaxID=1180 RepID=UPI002FF5AA9E